MVKEVTSDNEFNSYISGSKLCVVDFYATWCGPCKMIAPMFEQLSHKYSNAEFIKVDVDRLQESAATCGVHAMPTFQLYKQKSKLGEVVGGDMGKLEQLISQYADSFEAFKGSGKSLGGSSNAAVNPWADERKKHMEEYEKRRNQLKETGQLQQSTNEEDVAMDDNDEELKKALALSLEQPQSATTTATSTESSSSATSNSTDESIMQAIEASVNQEFLKELIGMEFPKLRALKALINTGSGSLETAVQWIFDHQDDKDIDAPIEYKVETEEEKAERMKRAREKAKELQQQARQKVTEQDKKNELEREKKRREMGKNIQQAQEDYKQQQRLREIEEMKREKQKEKEEKAKMKRLLEEDKARRKAERLFNEKNVSELQELAKEFPDIANTYLQQLGSGSTKSTASSSSTTSSTTQTTEKKEVTECTVQLRLLDGSTQKASFKPTDTLQTVWNHAKFLQANNSNFLLMNSGLPRKTFGPNDMNTTLQSAGLTPRASIICTPK